ncbi:hypothetical protein [Nevskia soli]|uniref:hypothetical protein n=1 Tax=Nevskia soli TaxID=418856 RepID=UPI0004A749B0|nr:hypothetical protein [Nevskia soli]
MACCAFLAFLIGQCLALSQSWRRRIAGLLPWRRSRMEQVPAAPRQPSWRKGLLAALAIEVGIVAGAGGGAWLARGSSTLTAPLAALCGIGKAVAAGESASLR